MLASHTAEIGLDYNQFPVWKIDSAENDVGKFTDAVSKGQDQAVEEANAESQIQRAQKEATQGQIKAAQEFVDSVILPIVEGANQDLKSFGLAIQYEIDRGIGLGLNLLVVTLGTLRPAPTRRSLAIKVIDGQVVVFRDGGPGQGLGSMEVMGQTSVESMLTELLNAVGYDQGKGDLR